MTTVPRPMIRADRAGYLLGETNVDGFADRADLPEASRRVIAGFAQAFAPKGLTPEQKQLLRGAKTVRGPSALLVALTQDADEADEGYLLGFDQLLAPEQRAIVRDPGSLLPDRAYPLSIGEVEWLTGASQRQLRYWEEIGLLPTHRLQENRRSYFRAGLIRAFVLAGLSPRAIETLKLVARGGHDASQLLVLIGAVLAGNPRPQIADTGRQLAFAVRAAECQRPRDGATL